MFRYNYIIAIREHSILTKNRSIEVTPVPLAPNHWLSISKNIHINPDYILGFKENVSNITIFFTEDVAPYKVNRTQENLTKLREALSYDPI